MAGCNTLTLSINPSCEALKKAGGVGKRVLFGLLEDLSAVEFAADGSNRILSFTFAATKGFISLVGKREKHNGTMALEVAENKTLRNHTTNVVIFYKTPEELKAIEDIIDAEGLFVVFETNAAQFEAWGVNKSAAFQNYGLKAASIDGGTGTIQTDNASYALALSGLHENLELIYQTTDVSGSITGLTTANPSVATMASTAAFEVGDTITFSALNGNQQIGGISVNGQSVVILSKTGTTLTLNANVTGVTPATSGTITKVADFAANLAALEAQII